MVALFNQDEAPMNQKRKLISLKTTCERTSLSRTSINRKRAAGEFPKEVPLSETRFAFVEDEVDEWIRERIEARERAQ